MKTALRISILLNILLLVWLGMAKKNAHRMLVEKPSSENAATVSLPAAQPPFRWSQLESTNYLTYIQNLRDIGCPGQTVRDIVTADVENLYLSRREALRRRYANRAEQAEELQNLLGGLDVEKSAVISELLGEPESRGNAGGGAPNHLADNSITLPLVWQNLDVSSVKLDPSQLEAVDSLRNSFVQQIGGTNQNPDDPAYLERWQKAQPAIDDALAGMIGREAYMEYQIRAGAPNN